MAVAVVDRPAAPLHLRHPGRGASLGAALLAAGTGLGAYVTAVGPVADGELHLDQMLAVDREWPLLWAARVINVGFGGLVGPLLLLLVSAFVATRNRAAGLILAASTVVGWLSVGVGKLVFARPRPVTSAVHALVVETGKDSFPSGHTAFAVALVIGIALALRSTGRSARWAWIVGVPFALFVAFTRLYLGAHFLFDVVASFLYVGGTMLVVAALFTVALRRNWLPERLLQVAGLAPRTPAPALAA